MPRLLMFFLCGAALDMLVRKSAPVDWLLEYADQMMWICIIYSLVVVFGLLCLLTARNRPVGKAVIGCLCAMPLVVRWARALGVPPALGQALFVVPLVVTITAAYRAGRERRYSRNKEETSSRT